MERHGGEESARSGRGCSCTTNGQFVAQELCHYDIFPEFVQCVMLFDADGTLSIAAGTATGEVLIANACTGSLLFRSKAAPVSIQCMLSYKIMHETYILCGCTGSNLCVVRCRDGECVQQIPSGQSGGVRSCSLCYVGDQLLCATVGNSDAVAIVDIHTGTMLQTVPRVFEEYGDIVSMLSDGSRASVVCWGPGSPLHVADVGSGTMSYQINVLDPAETRANVSTFFADTQAMFAVSTKRSGIRVFDLRTGSLVRVLQHVLSGEAMLVSATVVQRRPYLLCAGNVPEVALVDASTGEELVIFISSGAERYTHIASIAEEGRIIMAGGASGSGYAALAFVQQCVDSESLRRRHAGCEDLVPSRTRTFLGALIQKVSRACYGPRKR